MAVAKDLLQNIIDNLDPEQQQKLMLMSKVYPELANPKKLECFEIIKRAEIKSFAQKTTFMTTYSQCHFFTLLLKGVIRIYQTEKMEEKSRFIESNQVIFVL